MKTPPLAITFVLSGRLAFYRGNFFADPLPQADVLALDAVHVAVIGKKNG